MERNLSGRIEVVTPVTPALRQRLWEILNINLSDSQQAWAMSASGDYERLKPVLGATGAAADVTQATLMRLIAEGCGSVEALEPAGDERHDGARSPSARRPW